MQIERERAVKWAKMTTQWKKYSDSDKLYRRVNKGIPNSVRGTVWRHVMGIENVKEEGVYLVRGNWGMEYGEWGIGRIRNGSMENGKGLGKLGMGVCE